MLILIGPKRQIWRILKFQSLHVAIVTVLQPSTLTSVKNVVTGRISLHRYNEDYISTILFSILYRTGNQKNYSSVYFLIFYWYQNILVFKTVFSSFSKEKLSFHSIGRHSKSLDTSRKVCGFCHGEFALIDNRQLSRGSGSTPATPRTPNKFAMYVKENYGSMKEQGKDLKHGDIMKLLGKQFAEKNKISSWCCHEAHHNWAHLCMVDCWECEGFAYSVIDRDMFTNRTECVFRLTVFMTRVYRCISNEEMWLDFYIIYSKTQLPVPGILFFVYWFLDSLF